MDEIQILEVPLVDTGLPERSNVPPVEVAGNGHEVNAGRAKVHGVDCRSPAGISKSTSVQSNLTLPAAKSQQK